jgi:hypothetical protein
VNSASQCIGSELIPSLLSYIYIYIYIYICYSDLVHFFTIILSFISIIFHLYAIWSILELKLISCLSKFVGLL